MGTVAIIGGGLFIARIGGCQSNYSNGTRVGVVTKLSEKGVIFKSWEAQAVQGGVRMTSEGAAVANVFDFNVDPQMVEEVKKAMNSGKPVKLTYHQWLIRPMSIGSDYVVNKVEETVELPAH